MYSILAMFLPRKLRKYNFATLNPFENMGFIRTSVPPILGEKYTKKKKKFIYTYPS